MPYSTEADITAIEMTESELITLTDDEKRGIVNSQRVAAAILKADTEIDGYCKDRYEVPFSSAPEEIKFLSAVMAGYWLCRRRRTVTESVLDKYAKALSRLKAISRGEYTLTGVSQKDTSGIGSTTAGEAHTFSRAKSGTGGSLKSGGSTDIW